MSYSNPLTCMYNFPSFDFGTVATPITHSIAGPSGMKGRLREIGVAVTEVFACDATNAQVDVGTSADGDAFGRLNIPDLSADNTVVNSGDDTDAIIDADIPADTCVHVTCTDGTDGTAVTGQGYPYVIIDWF